VDTRVTTRSAGAVGSAASVIGAATAAIGAIGAATIEGIASLLFSLISFSVLFRLI
jgi:hypothetical protein